MYCGDGYDYPEPMEWVTVYARTAEGGYVMHIASYMFPFYPHKNIHLTRQERLDQLRNLVWCNMRGVELKGVCAWLLPPDIPAGTMHALPEPEPEPEQDVCGEQDDGAKEQD